VTFVPGYSGGSAPHRV